MNPPDLSRPVLKKDTVKSAEQIKAGWWLFELTAGPRAHINRWVIADQDGAWRGEIKRPRYGSRNAEVYLSGNVWSAAFELKLRMPATAVEPLVQEVTDFVVKYG